MPGSLIRLVAKQPKKHIITTMQAIDLDNGTVSEPIQDTIRVSALHAFAYCPRLFYLEEVEELY